MIPCRTPRLNVFSLLCLWVCSFTLAPVWAQSANWEFEQPLQGQNLPVGTMLRWHTSFERGLSSYTVERSEDGSSFREIGLVECAGDSEQGHRYHFLDATPAAGDQVWYRLKINDVDGGYTYTEAIVVRKQYDNNFAVVGMSDVMAQDLFELTIEAFVDGVLEYTLSDARGTVMIQDHLAVIRGINELTIDLSSQPEGIYKVGLRMGSELEQLVIRHQFDELVKKPNVASKHTDKEKSRN